ncbi:JAB domain-containing protein [Caviibacterium pharyngocola]|uniref:MPN domain-containing protein n=1 Tax=Caviibacterium pharyngocola TaxID=28159 RepID=A0A2M8RV46_9PAST|nr:DNA repair protein RadC [Caviibacterium pharyngocola]PJG82768.1 hypothetical protein CVP04_07335 [Caviibacterium pharyngocola]
MNTQHNQSTWQEKLQKATALLEEILRENPVVYRSNKEIIFNTSDSAIKFCSAKIGFSEREEFLVIFLDNKHCLIKAEIMFQGSINTTSVYPREIIKRGLQLNAAAAILSHNHPSGDVTPSQSDQLITQKIKQACELVDIRIIDHIVVAPNDHYSFLEQSDM